MLRAIAKPMVGNTEGPIWAALCNLRIGRYLSGCLRSLVPLRGEGMDWLLTRVPGSSESGLLLGLAVSTSGQPSGPSGVAWLAAGLARSQRLALGLLRHPGWLTVLLMVLDQHSGLNPG